MGFALVDALTEGLQEAETPEQWAIQRVLRRKASLGVVMLFIAACRFVHRPQHLEAAGREEHTRRAAMRRNPILSHVV
jgi:hypothetical protein